MFLRSHTLYICTILLLELMFLSLVKNKFSLSNYYIMAILVNKTQRAKKVVSDSPGLVDFVIGLVNSVFNLPDGQVMFF